MSNEKWRSSKQKNETSACGKAGFEEGEIEEAMNRFNGPWQNQFGCSEISCRKRIKVRKITRLIE